MRMQPPDPDTCSVAVGDASLVIDADGTFDVPDVHVDRLVELGWRSQPSPDPNMAPLTLEPTNSSTSVLTFAQDGKIVEAFPTPVLEVDPGSGAVDESAGDGAGEALPPTEGATITAIGGVSLEAPVPISELPSADEANETTYREAIAAGYTEAEAREIAYGGGF